MDLIYLFVRALFLTVVFECVILSLLVRRSFLKICVIVSLLNLLTNPVLNYLHLIHDVPVFILEFVVVFIELFPLKAGLNLSWKDAFLFSILINAGSYSAGYFIMTLLYFS